MGSERRIAAARKIEPVVRERDARDTEEELPPTSRDTWPGELDADVRNDTIPTPPPSSGLVEHVTIPSMPAVKVDDQT